MQATARFLTLFRETKKELIPKISGQKNFDKEKKSRVVVPDLPRWATGNRPSFAERLPDERWSITILVPAFNEEESIADTIRSLLEQTAYQDYCANGAQFDIIVVDDCSKDRTGDIAKELGVRVIRTPKNTGKKSSGLNYALQFVNTQLLCIVDADTTLASNAVEKLLPYFNDEKTGAVCGFVLVQNKDALGLGRQVEYCAGLPVLKGAQSNTNGMVVANGCFSIYRMDFVKKSEVFTLPSRAEDMYLTFLMIMHGLKVYCEPMALCYAKEPTNLKMLKTQLIRWKEGFHENVHRAFWDIVRAKRFSLLYFIVSAYYDALYIPAVAIWLFFSQSMAMKAMPERIATVAVSMFLLLVFGDILIAWPVAIVQGVRLGIGSEIMKGVFVYPFMRVYNMAFFVTTFFNVFIFKKTDTTWGKGH
ncbi:MAG: glycosyltransferase family 2 protein [Candidatus Yonathbacteria bacterium]|nr:glycosyltransferase family 2 protein [Candidatus Yonathbacteria bacterium]